MGHYIKLVEDFHSQFKKQLRPILYPHLSEEDVAKRIESSVMCCTGHSSGDARGVLFHRDTAPASYHVVLHTLLNDLDYMEKHPKHCYKRVLLIADESHQWMNRLEIVLQKFAKLNIAVTLIQLTATPNYEKIRNSKTPQINQGQYAANQFVVYDKDIIYKYKRNIVFWECRSNWTSS